MECAGVQRSKVMITCDGLQVLIHHLTDQGYQVLGPRLRDGAIIYDRIESPRDLPEGWTDRQEGGHYGVERRADTAPTPGNSFYILQARGCGRRAAATIA